jgi:hypothetical protein
MTKMLDDAKQSNDPAKMRIRDRSESKTARRNERAYGDVRQHDEHDGKNAGWDDEGWIEVDV